MGYQTGYSSPSDSPPMGNGGGKMRVAPQRKKSTSSSNDEEDLMNVPSLQMRIQILQQRVSCKQKKFKNDLHLKKIICTKKQKLSYLSIDFYEIRKYFVKPLFPFLNVNLFSDSHKQFYSTKIFYQKLKCSCKYFYSMMIKYLLFGLVV